MRRKINNIISVIHSIFRVLLLKLVHGKNASLGLIERISPNVVLEVNRGATIRLCKNVRIHSGSKVKVRDGGTLTIGKNVRINYNCMFFCRHEINIGGGCEFGPGVLVYDHDHDFRHPCGLAAREYNVAAVNIGENCWIGANTVILKGTTIGNRCVVGAGSVLKGNYPDDSLITQKRVTSVRTIERKLDNANGISSQGIHCDPCL